MVVLLWMVTKLMFMRYMEGCIIAISVIHVRYNICILPMMLIKVTTRVKYQLLFALWLNWAISKLSPCGAANSTAPISEILRPVTSNYPTHVQGVK